MGTRTTLTERIIDRLTTEEARQACEWAKAPAIEFVNVRNATILKGWLYRHITTPEVRAALVRLTLKACDIEHAGTCGRCGMSENES